MQYAHLPIPALPAILLSTWEAIKSATITALKATMLTILPKHVVLLDVSVTSWVNVLVLKIHLAILLSNLLLQWA